MSEARARAAGALSLAEDSTAEDALSAFLRTLPASGFVPQGASVAALNALAGRAVPHDPEESGGIGLPDEVEEFARRFWTLEPAERSARWAALAEQPADARTSVRLAALKIAVGLDARTPADPVEAEIAALARDLFLLAPGARSVRRNEWLLKNVARHAELCRAAAALGERSPTTAELDAVLFARLKSEFAATEFLAAAAAQPLPDPPPGVHEEPIRFSFTERLPLAQASPQYEQPAQRESRTANVGCLTLFAFFAFVRLISCAVSTSSSSSVPTWQYSPPRPYSPSVPSSTPSDSQPRVRKVFTAAEVERFKDYRPGSGMTPPPGYVEWLLAGKPDPPGYPRPRK
jgi:hypothetical protein